MSKFADTQRAVRENDPPIEVNQVWACRDGAGDILRMLRIIAKHPDGDWIIEELPAKMRVWAHELKRIPEFNLRYVCFWHAMYVGKEVIERECNL